MVYGLFWPDKTAIGLHKTAIEGDCGLLDKTSIGRAKTATGARVDTSQFAFLVLQSPNLEPQP